ncbi:MAG: DUF3320 domain-containing protein [Ilumatobacteraceae bacterium]
MSAQVGAWRDELINLTRTNRLLYFKHTQSASIEIVEPGMVKVFDLLQRDRFWEFYEPPVDANGRPLPRTRPARAAELITDKTTPAQLAKSLRAIERRALDTFTERGLWTMYVGVGFLDWIDPKDGKPVQTPLLLQPVEFGRNTLSEPFRLRATDDDAILNPALVVKLANDLGVTLPSLDDLDDVNPESVFAAFEPIVRRQPGWSLVDRSVLHPFSFLKEAMYRDLLDHETDIVEHPLVQVLALGSSAPNAHELVFDPVPFEQLDQYAAPEDLHHVRDADASQRRCVLAARQGHSFVMDGPPGTGKSQTITNIIAELLFEGKTVLFVSDKAAALEVVHKRLREAKLDEFALELHSHNATRKAVANELGLALSRHPRAKPQMSELERTKLVKARERLASYADAINEVRPPLNRSLHDVLGRLAELSGHISAPSPAAITLELDTPTLAELVEWAEALGRAWGPVDRSETFLWRDLQSNEVGPSVSEARRRKLDDAMRGIDALETRLESVDDELGLGLLADRAAASRLLDVLRLLDERHDVEPAWLHAPDHAAIAQAVTVASAGIGELNSLAASLTREYSDAWRAISATDATAFSARVAAVNADELATSVTDEQTASDLLRDKERLERGVGSLRALDEKARHLAATFRVNEDTMSLKLLTRLAQLAQLADSSQRPEPGWFGRAQSSDVAEARRVLDGLIAELKVTRTRAEEVFRPSVVELDLKGLRARFAELHTGLRKLGGAYRADKKLLAQHVLSGKVDSAVIDRLPDAVTLQNLLEGLRAAEGEHAGILGSYYRGDATEFARIDQALEVARTALSHAGTEISSEALRQELSLTAEPNPELVSLGKSVETLIEAIDPDVAARVRDRPIFESAQVCLNAAVAVDDAVHVLEGIDARLGRRTAVGMARRTLHEILRHEELRRWLDQYEPDLHRILGRQYDGTSTDWRSVERAADWAAKVNAALGRTPTAMEALAMLASTFSSEDVRPLLDDLDQLLAESLSPFLPHRAEELRDELSVSFATASQLLAAMYSTVGDAEEWLRYDRARRQLTQAGMGDVVRLCVDRRVDKAEVSPIHERAILERWTDLTLKKDEARLSPLAAADRDGLVADFRQYDELLAFDSAASVVNSCSDRRPTTIIGETQVIKREAEKQRRHMPIRTLLDKAGRAAQALKPCFMMSPLSVSQYLPPGLLFDVVIFDEASQVRPSDSINCLYRGSQTIVAGDQRQLPPTSFFQLASTDTSDTYVEDELDDFQSVLDLAKASAAIQSLPLTWHYRSEHEALITYSNRRFYDSSLTTFPSALQEAEDIGIEFFKVDGVYERGTTRTNPIEARKVVERVLFHRRNHPHLSLGVIAFSASQQEAIETAIELAGLQHPDLLTLLSDDRLDGFFVKNLENVQGDERDIILFSIGYGPDAEAKMTANFGPLIKAGGWRRLNVAITRARRRVEVIASFFPNALPASATNDGVRHLRGYLEYARTGNLAVVDIDDNNVATSKVADVVAATIEGWGHKVDRNVGAGSFRIDVGVRHPSKNGQYLLGIQCDGETYGSAAVTRDRDRLTQQVLNGLGWKLQRVWATAWFRDRGAEERRLRDAINEALDGSVKAKSAGRIQPASPPMEVEHQRVNHDLPSWATRYQPWNGERVYSGLPPHAPDSRSKLRELIRSIIEVEGPVAVDRIVRTVRTAWPVGSGGSKTTEAVHSVTASMTGHQIVSPEPGFVALPDRWSSTIRVPTDGDPRTRRTIDEVPWAEMYLAIQEVTRGASTVVEDELVTFIARLYGWNRTGGQISAGVGLAIAHLVETGELHRTPDGTISSATA